MEQSTVLLQDILATASAPAPMAEVIRFPGHATRFARGIILVVEYCDAARCGNSGAIGCRGCLNWEERI